jgi:fluoride exporter
MSLRDIALVAAGGAVGSVLRYLATIAASGLFGVGFPYGTVLVNVTGSFAMGVLIEVIARRFEASEALRLLIATGVLGGYTTFSSFSLDTAALWERGQHLLAVVYVAASLGLGVAALFCGLWLARSLA